MGYRDRKTGLYFDGTPEDNAPEKMHDPDEFERLTKRLRVAGRSRPEPGAIPKVDAMRLDARELDALHACVTGVGRASDRAILEDAAKRQAAPARARKSEEGRVEPGRP